MAFINRNNLFSQVLFNLAQVRPMAAAARYPVEHGPAWLRERVGRYKRRHKRLGYAMVPQGKYRAVIRSGLNRLQQTVGPGGIGDYLEFGVHSCTTLLCMYRELEALHLNQVRLFGFDSFEGLPVSDEPDDVSDWNPGDFRSEYEFALQILKDEGVDPSRVTLTRGWFCDTATPAFRAQHRLAKASVIMVDCDQYLGAKDALTFCAPLIKDHAVILFDDWNSNDLAARGLGEKRAFDEFLSGGEFTAEPCESYAKNAAVFFVSRRQIA